MRTSIAARHRIRKQQKRAAHAARTDNRHPDGLLDGLTADQRRNKRRDERREDRRLLLEAEQHYAEPALAA